jgi:hypothetical protein
VLALGAILDEAIVKSQEEDDGDPIFHEVNIKDVNPFEDERTQSGVYDSLAKRGLIEGSIGEDRTGKVFEYVCITPKGLQTLQLAKGMH